MKKSIKSIIMLVLALSIVTGAIFAFAACNKAPDAPNTIDNGFVTLDKGAIVVGYTDVQPLNYTDANGTLIGFDTELATQTFTDLGYTNIVFKEIKWENKYIDLANGNIDCIWNGFTANSSDDDGIARTDKVDFSSAYMENKQVVVVRDSKYNSLESLNKSGIRGKAESSSAGEDFIKSSISNAALNSVSSQIDAINDLNLGGCEFAVVDKVLATNICGKGDYASLKIVESIETDAEVYAVGFEKDSDLVDQVNIAFELYVANGYMMKLAEKYEVAGVILTDLPAVA